MVLISAESPAGDASRGTVESMETVRIVMSPSTFAEVTELFVRTLKDMGNAAGMPTPDSNGHVGRMSVKKN